MSSAALFTAGLLAPTAAFAAFGITSGGGFYTVDTGGHLVFKVNQSNGDISSLKYNGGPELNDQSKGSHLSSGLGSATVSYTTYNGGNIIKITASTSTVTHYYMVRNGYDNIYMATYISAEPSVGELRWITRIQGSQLPNGPAPSNNNGNDGNVESTDVFHHPDGTTTSKFYGNSRAIDLSYTGATGSGVGVFMVYDKRRESSSGGPFFRDIQNQGGGDQEIYNYMNSGHNQTEAFRTGVLNGPYTLSFTNGAAPSTNIDYSWIDAYGVTLTGYVPDSARGYVQGKGSGVLSGQPIVVGFANATAQYWCTANASTQNFSSPLMKPGTYTQTLYQGELAVATKSVTVTAGAATTSNITSALAQPATIWQIGTWDGTPAGFLNATRVNTMHPSDVRMSDWGPVTYTVGSSGVGSFPAYQWNDGAVNNPTTIKFNLTSVQVAAHTVRIGITAAYAGGRPKITVNSWSSANPSPSTQPDSRSLTIGTYRGNNTTYTYSVPASAFVAGANTMTISVISGSGSSGYLAAGVSYDALELDN